MLKGCHKPHLMFPGSFRDAQTCREAAGFSSVEPQ